MLGRLVHFEIEEHDADRAMRFSTITGVGWLSHCRAVDRSRSPLVQRDESVGREHS